MGNIQTDTADIAPLDTINAIEAIELGHDGTKTRSDRAARAGMEQNYLIPTAGEQAVGTKWEKYTFMLFRMSVGGTAVSTYCGAKNQAFLNGAFPLGKMAFAGREVPVNSYLLNLNGILFAIQFVLLITLGPYADYGVWRATLPSDLWVLFFPTSLHISPSQYRLGFRPIHVAYHGLQTLSVVVFESIIYICCFALAGINEYSDWRTVNALWFLGNLSLNVANTFYYAGFPAVVRNLTETRRSERGVLEGTKLPEYHAQFESLSRAKFYNYCIGVASTINLVLLGIATGIAAAIGVKTTAELLKGYRVLICFFAVLEVAGTMPYMYIFAKRRRPGQQLPQGIPFYLAGVVQIRQAIRYVWDLKQFLIYLVAYFVIQEAFGAAGTIGGILQNEVIHYNTIELSGLTALDFFTGATGTLFVNWIQQRWKLKSKTMLLYGACMTVVTELWGGIGAFTHVIGFHHPWEFWLSNAWNFQAAAWNSYYVILLSEVVPQPKMYMFFALLNCIGKM